MLLFHLLVKLGLSHISVCSRKGAFLTFSVPLALFLLLLFLSFFEQFRLLGTWQWFCFLDFRFFQPRVLHGATPVLGNGKVGWLVAPGAVLIYLFSVGARSKSRLGLGVDGLLDHQSKLSSSRSQCSSSAKIEGFKPSQKYLSIVGLVEAPNGSYFNKIDYRYFRWLAQSNIDLAWYWRSRLNLPQILLAKARLSFRFFLKKSLNSAHVIGAPLERRLCWCQCYTTDLQRNEGANGMQLGPLALTMSKWSLHC